MEIISLTVTKKNTKYGKTSMMQNISWITRLLCTVIMLFRFRLITGMSVYKFGTSWWFIASKRTQNWESNEWQIEHDLFFFCVILKYLLCWWCHSSYTLYIEYNLHAPAYWCKLVQQNVAAHYSTTERCILPTRHDSLWLLMFPKLNTLKDRQYDDMGTIEHIAVK
jgi:hypothetical protein